MTLLFIVIILGVIIALAQKGDKIQKEKEYKAKTETSPQTEREIREEWEAIYKSRFDYVDPNQDIYELLKKLHGEGRIPWAPSYHLLCQNRDYTEEEIQKRYLKPFSTWYTANGNLLGEEQCWGEYMKETEKIHNESWKKLACRDVHLTPEERAELNKKFVETELPVSIDTEYIRAHPNLNVTEHDTVYTRMKRTQAYKDLLDGIVQRDIRSKGYAYGAGGLSSWQKQEEKQKQRDEMAKRYPWIYN